MADRKSLTERWEDFRPSKGLWLWSCAGSVAATMIVGFAFGGWVTGGTAQELAENAAERARAQLVAGVCVERFVNGNQFADRLAALKKADSWDRDNLIEDGGWLTVAGMEDPVGDAADLCAQQLAEMEVPEMAPDTTMPGAPAVGEKPATAADPAA